MTYKKFKVLGIVSFVFLNACNNENQTIEAQKVPSQVNEQVNAADLWQAKEINLITDADFKKKVEYGKELVAHTAKYLGPNGSVKQISNGLNCQNCHLDAGTKAFGNNYGSVASLYPKFRSRSGSVENVTKRINDCFERSLNGEPLDSLSNEMQAMKAYITYIGSDVEKGKKAYGSGLKSFSFLNRAADKAKGKQVYIAQCQTCHQADGQGLMAETGDEYIYPPLWGKHSYNDGAGLSRVTNFAKYAKFNMPLGATYDKPLLTDEEAWDVAAYVNSQFRPHIETPLDFPDLTKKPIDHPYGPYADNFSIRQHKYGPFEPIISHRNSK